VFAPDPARRGEACFRGQMMSAGNDFIKVEMQMHGTLREAARHGRSGKACRTRGTRRLRLRVMGRVGMRVSVGDTAAW
jgi:hypothetical protein